MKHKALLAAASLVLAGPALAQTQPAQNHDGTPYCQIQGATLLWPSGGAPMLNYTVRQSGDMGRAVLASGPNMFDTTPELVLFYGINLGTDGNPTSNPLPYSITTSFGTFDDGKQHGDADALKLGFSTGSLQSPALTVSSFARDDGRVSATLVVVGSGLDERDVSVPDATFDALAQSILRSGATMTVRDGGREIARVPIPAGGLTGQGVSALQWARRATPLLQNGQCPE